MNHTVVIILLGLLSVIEGNCPIRCNCTENTINCVSKNLEYVPSFEDLSNNPVIIDLSGNSIQLIDIDAFSFDKTEHVKEIYLNNSGLVYIEDRAFEELDNLQELYLSDNLLNSLPETLIEDNENLILLDISSNYFNEMPKIKSTSVEFLLIANSRISKISNEALNDLPNLRILVLSQNNLKTINPMIFNHMSKLFFISLAFNPWNCNCQTIKLFEFLNKKNFIDLTEPIQCLRDDKIYVEIYNDSGIVPTFKDVCNNFTGNFNETETQSLNLNSDAIQSNILLKNMVTETGTLDSDVNITTSLNEKTLSKDINYSFYFSDFCYILILGIAVMLSLIIGGLCGSYFTFKYMKRNIKQSDSQKQLLSKSDDILSFL